MKSLILRDLRAYKFFYLLLMVITVLYAYLNIRFGSVDGILGFVLILMPSFSGIVLFIGDNELLPLFASLPVTRKSLVVGKYLSTYLIAFLLIGFTFIITWYLSMNYSDAQKDLGLLLSIQGLTFSVIPITFIVSICYPLLFRHGLKIGIRILLGVFAVTYGVGMIVFENAVQANMKVPRRGVFIAAMTLFDYLEKRMTPLYLYGTLTIILILMLTLSVTISVRWFSHKDI